MLMMLSISRHVVLRLCLQLRQIAHCMVDAGVRRLVVSVDEEDSEAKALWDK